MKAIDNINTEDAKVIFNTKFPNHGLISDADMKSKVRKYLRDHKLNPDDVIMKIWKEEQQKPKHKAF